MMRLWRRLSIRWRITIGSVVVGAMLLTGAGVLFRQQVEQAQINSDKKLLYGATTPYLAQIRDHPTQIDEPRGEARLVVIDPSGRSGRQQPARTGGRAPRRARGVGCGIARASHRLP